MSFKTLLPVGLMVLSDGMVHFLKIAKKINKSTKTILWLNDMTALIKVSFVFLEFRLSSVGETQHKTEGQVQNPSPPVH